MLKWETFSLKVTEDKLVFNNCTAEVQEAIAEECLAKLALSPAQQKKHNSSVCYKLFVELLGVPRTPVASQLLSMSSPHPPSWGSASPHSGLKSRCVSPAPPWWVILWDWGVVWASGLPLAGPEAGPLTGICPGPGARRVALGLPERVPEKGEGSCPPAAVGPSHSVPGTPQGPPAPGGTQPTPPGSAEGGLGPRGHPAGPAAARRWPRVPGPHGRGQWRWGAVPFWFYIRR